MKCNHEHHKELKGQWGPHTIRVECADCGRWLKWGSVKTTIRYTPHIPIKF